jgi:hypothetical protein
MIFATVEEIKGLNEPPITGDTFDELIDVYMNSIGTTFENYCNRKFLSNTYTEYIRGAGEYLFLQETPIRQVNNIWVDWDAEFEESDKLDSSDFKLLTDGRVWSLLFPSCANQFNVKVEYDGGYDSVEVVNGDYPIPPDLKLAFIRQVQYDIKRRKDIGLTSVTFKDGSINKQIITELLPQVQRTLDYYRYINI